jgi:hypothetical protein
MGRRAWRVALAAAAAVLVLAACGPERSVGFGALSVTGVSPSAGSLPAGAVVTLTGSGFVALASGPALQVSVCGVALSDVEVVGESVRLGLPGGVVVDAVVGSTLTGAASAPLVVGAVEVVRVDGRRAVWAAEASCDAPQTPAGPPVAAGDAPADDSAPGDPFHAPLTPMGGGAAWTLAAPGLLANDDLGGAAGAVVTFGGGDLGGTVDDHAAGATVTVLGHRLRVDADGGVEFLPAPGFTGPFRFAYALDNGAGRSTAEVVIAVGVRPSAGAALVYPHALIGNVGIDTARSTGATVPLVGDALDVTVTASSGGTASVQCAAGATTCTFAFEPDAGHTGAAWFEATAANGFGSVGPTRVNLSFEGRVWFVDAAAAPGGDGTLAAPFDCLRSVGCAANGVLGAGDAMFVAPGSYGRVGDVSAETRWGLPAGARLIGAGASASLPELLERVWPEDAPAPPATGRAAPVLDASSTFGAPSGPWIRPGTDNLLAGITLAGVTDGAIVGANFGTLTVHDVTIERVREVIGLRNGTLRGGFTSVSNDRASGIAWVGIALEDVDTVGIFSFGEGAMTALTGLEVLGGAGAFAYDGDLAAVWASFLGDVNAVRVAGMTGGSLTLRGDVTVDSGGVPIVGNSVAVRVANQTGDAQVRLDGAKVSIGGGTAVRLLENAAGTSVVFEGGASIAASGAARGLHATEGGAVGGTLGSVASETGIAVELGEVSIGVAGLTIEELNAGTAAGGPEYALRAGNTAGPGALRVLGGLVLRATGSAVQLVGTSAAVDIAGLDVRLDVCPSCFARGVVVVDAADVTVRGSAFTGGWGGLAALFLPSADGTSVVFENNVVGSTADAGISVLSDGETFGPRSRAVTIVNNTIGGSGAPVGGDGIRIRHTGGAGGGAMLRVEVRNNAIPGYGLDGISVGVRGDVGSAARVDATLVGNTVGPSAPGASSVVAEIDAGHSLCLDVQGTVSNPGDVALVHASTGAMILPGYLGAPTSLASVESFIASRNAVSAVGVVNQGLGSGFPGGPPCALP